jgi:hypothetical protein
VVTRLPPILLAEQVALRWRPELRPEVASRAASGVLFKRIENQQLWTRQHVAQWFIPLLGDQEVVSSSL